MYINNYSKNQDAAWKLIQFMTSPAQQLYTFKRSSTCRRSQPDQLPEGGKAKPVLRPALAREEIFQTVAPAKNPYYADMSTAMSTQFQANVLGQGHARAGGEQSSDPGRADRQAAPRPRDERKDADG